MPPAKDKPKAKPAAKSKVKEQVLSALYWVATLAFIAGAIFLMFGGADALHKAFPPPPAPPDVPVPAAELQAPHATPPPAQPKPKNDDDSVKIRRDSARNPEPMGELTKFYQRDEYPVLGASDKHTLAYFIYKPPAPYPAGLKFPLVLLLHDVLGVDNAGQFLIAGDMPVRHPAFIVAPELPFGRQWSTPENLPEMPGFRAVSPQKDGLRDAVQLIGHLEDIYPIDIMRVYVIGCSEGGFGAFGAALRYPDIFAAAVPIAGGWATEDAAGFKKVPIWAFHGAGDNYFPASLSRDAVSYIKAYGGRASYTEVPGLGHNCDAPQFYTATLWDWLFKQHK